MQALRNSIHNTMNKQPKLTEQAILANIEHYRNLYTEHTALTRKYNQELWRWHYELTKLNELEQIKEGDILVEENSKNILD